jgi:hypothetical protein
MATFGPPMRESAKRLRDIHRPASAHIRPPRQS